MVKNPPLIEMVLKLKKKKTPFQISGRNCSHKKRRTLRHFPSLIEMIKKILKNLIIVAEENSPLSLPNFKKGIRTFCSGFSAAKFKKLPQMNFY